MKHTCSNCKFFKETDTPGFYDHCRLNPTPAPIQFSDYWCGQWQAIGDDEKTEKTISFLGECAKLMNEEGFAFHPSPVPPDPNSSATVFTGAQGGPGTATEENVVKKINVPWTIHIDRYEEVCEMLEFLYDKTEGFAIPISESRDEPMFERLKKWYRKRKDSDAR